MSSETRKAASKWNVIETGGKVYLYTDHTIDEYEATKGYITSGPPPGRPLSKKDCIRLARILLNHGE